MVVKVILNQTFWQNNQLDEDRQMNHTLVVASWCQDLFWDITIYLLWLIHLECGVGELKKEDQMSEMTAVANILGFCLRMGSTPGGALCIKVYMVKCSSNCQFCTQNPGVLFKDGVNPRRGTLILTLTSLNATKIYVRPYPRMPNTIIAQLPYFWQNIQLDVDPQMNHIMVLAS